MLKRFIILCIRIYQATLSPDHGLLRHFYTHGCCCYEPTCSEYGMQVVKQHGAIRGSIMMLKRVATCTPWARPTDARIRSYLKREQSTSS